MSATPVDDHTQDFDELAALAALEILEGDELLRFQQHAEHCERCQLMVRLDREALARAAPEMDPSPDFKQRLMERARQELAASPASPTAEVREPPREVSPPTTLAREPAPLRQPPNVIPFWRRSAWVSALAAVLVVGLGGVGAYSYQNQVIASYPLSGSLQGNVVVQVRRSGATELEMRNAQNPRSGFLYEFWIIPQGGQPVSAGVTSTGQATVSLPHLSPGTTVAVTEEERRVESPTAAPIMVGVVD